MSSEPEPEALRAVLRRHGDRHPVPAALRAEIEGWLGQADATPAGTADHLPPIASAAPEDRTAVPRLVAGLRRRAAVWSLVLGFAGGVACALAWPLLLVQFGAAALGEAVVAEHATALRQGLALAVRSTDSHTVKPWLSARLGYSPQVQDLSAAGFPLDGARIGRIDGQEVAVLIYHFREHPIAVYVLRGALGRRAATLSGGREGYHLRSWSAGDLSYVAVSDVSVDRLETLTRLLSNATPARPD